MLIVTRKVDELLEIGDDLLVGPTDINPKMVRLLARGRVMGGSDDGAGFTKSADLGINGEMRLGDHVVITVVDIRGDKVRLAVQAPATVSVHRKEFVDDVRRRRQRGEL